jgi:hypothetical protein
MLQHLLRLLVTQNGGLCRDVARGEVALAG